MFSPMHSEPKKTKKSKTRPKNCNLDPFCWWKKMIILQDFQAILQGFQAILQDFFGPVCSALVYYAVHLLCMKSAPFFNKVHSKFTKLLNCSGNSSTTIVVGNEMHILFDFVTKLQGVWDSTAQNSKLLIWLIFADFWFIFAEFCPIFQPQFTLKHDLFSHPVCVQIVVKHPVAVAFRQAAQFRWQKCDFLAKFSCSKEHFCQLHEWSGLPQY